MARARAPRATPRAVSGAPTIAVTLDPGFDAAVITVTPPTGSTGVNVWRTGPSGEPAFVRGAQPAPATPPAQFTIRDYEAPLGVPLSYQAAGVDAAGVQGPSSAAVVFTLPAGAYDDPWLNDLGHPSNNQKVVVERFNPAQHAAPVGIHHILSRRDPIATSDIAWTASYELTFATLDDGGWAKARDALGAGLPFLLRFPPEHGHGNVYLQPVTFDIDRVGTATRDERRLSAACWQVARPSPILYAPTPPVAYRGIQTNYATYTAVDAKFSTYDQLAYDRDSAVSGGDVPWLPEDV